MCKVSQACGLQLAAPGLHLELWKNASVGPRIAAFFFRDQAEHISCQKAGYAQHLTKNKLPHLNIKNI